ncbi:(2Fe-2S) ferredoxin [Tenacibaculum sp. MAR_2009_124]|uniref:(2Fe-2S) ferredoxin domain-containing protein n=1 Tax=Tenacibaculum sp. MAR_2009_124 TaxID=1250059 RepID=UPI00089B43D6|nr:(2Fe-2S) ferredoxin domain-containing protein [Tenacibaculum sp. MAR_2009_124]SEB86469.1 (2Fe-2S) ferredoxin [Tenacibaculum sp. MAR_2009_124]
MGKNVAKAKTTFLFCDGGSCKKANGEMAVREARAHLRNEELWDDTHTIRTRCNGRCEDAPTWIVEPGNFWYKNLTPEKAIEIVDGHTKNNQSIPEYLLFQDGWKNMVSDNERSLKPVVFNRKTDSEYGNVLVSRSSASDQYLYPLFKKLFEHFTGFRITFPNNVEIMISKKHQVEYTDVFDMIVSGEETNFKLAIGPITKVMEKDVAQEIKDRKVGVAEVIWDRENSEYIGYLRLKNRKGKFLMTISIPKSNNDAWNYFLSIYLNMDINKVMNLEF